MLNFYRKFEISHVMGNNLRIFVVDLVENRNVSVNLTLNEEE